MNIKKKNTSLTIQNSWNGIKITEKAIKQIIFLINCHKSQGVRISVKKTGCAGFKYIMQLVEKEKKEDIKIVTKNVFIYVDTNYIQLIEGTQIDFIKNNVNKVFKFYNKKLSNFCGCGQSFSIN